MSENEKNSEKNIVFGRKIFFIYPSGAVQNQVISELSQDEFEVYIIKNETKFRQILWNYPGSIVFASINEAMKESAWEEFIRGIQGSPETAKVDLGIIASTEDKALKAKYMEQFKPRCGYTVIKSDYPSAVKQLSNILNGIDAKGRRKYIRMVIEKETNATLNLSMNGTFINGVIKDISAVGFSCVFADDPGLKKSNLYDDIQLRLQSQLVKVEGIVFGSRMDGNEKVYVILFTQRVDSNVRTKIRKYIQSNLQNRVEQELK